MIILSKLTPYIADSDLGLDTSLVIKGFKNRAEIEFFWERLGSISWIVDANTVIDLSEKVKGNKDDK